MKVGEALAVSTTKIKIKIDFSLNGLKSYLTEDRLNFFQFTPNLHRNVDAIILILILTSC